jgi:hypothetical protein
MRRTFFLVLALWAMGSWFGTTPAAAQDYSACNGVQVIVDYGSLGGGVQSGCATSFSTGTAALRSAGLTPALDNGMVTQIRTKPATSDINKAYWSYWHATRNADGSYSSWSYSNLGATSYHPTKGNAEGWHFVSLSDAASGPNARPAKNPVGTATANSKSTTPTTASTSADPGAAATSATTSAASSAAETSAAAASAPGDSPSAAATPSWFDEVVSDPQDSGTPVPLIATGATVAFSGAGAGAWWFLKGRKR